MSRTHLKNDDTLPELKKMWKFLTRAGVTDHFCICSFGVNKLKFQVSLKSIMFEGVKNNHEEC